MKGSPFFGLRRTSRNSDPTVTVTGANSLLIRITDALEQINTNLKSNPKTGGCNCPSKDCNCPKDANLVYFDPQKKFFDALLPLYQENGRVEFFKIGQAIKQLATSTDQDKAKIRAELVTIQKRIGNIKIQIKTMQMLFQASEEASIKDELVVWSEMTTKLDAIDSNINEVLKKLNDENYLTANIQESIKALGELVNDLITTFKIPEPKPESINPAS